MSLDYNLTGIKDYEKVCLTEDDGRKVHSARTDSLIWATMYIGMEQITEKNFEEFYIRLSIYERIFGASVYRYVNMKREGVYITLADVKNHIGLKTNADRLTDNQFDSKLMKRLRSEVPRGA